MMFDFNGIAGVLKYFNDEAEKDQLEVIGSIDTADNIRKNLCVDLDHLYIALQNEDGLIKRCGAIIKECKRYVSLFTQIKGNKCNPNWYASLLYLYGSANMVVGIVLQHEQSKIIEKPQPEQIPPELATKEAKAYFDKAIELGLMDGNYKWHKGLQMLACFAREMSIRLNLGKGINSYGITRISWKPFETLFSIDRGKLRLNYNDIQKIGQQPTESDLIDKVFE